MSPAQSETSATATLLAAIREGLAKPFADPVHIRNLEFTRAEARAAERVLSRVLVSESTAALSPFGAVEGVATTPSNAAPAFSDHSFHEVQDAA